MNTSQPNILLIMSDQHNPKLAGYAGDDVVRTPNLDRLAARGASFSNAYCTSAICVPARASIATGRYVHEIGNWDNAAPYVGDHPSWGHHLGDAGYRVTTIGKLHYRDPSDDTGFPDQRLPMHIAGRGDLRGIAKARRLSEISMRNIRQNLFFAFVYNAAGVPVAAGVLYPLFGMLLSPMLAAAAMSMSSVSVIGNALRLRRMPL